MKTTRTISEIRKAAAPMLEETRWIVQDHESYGLATTARETLGQLPHKLRKTYIHFDDNEERTYGGVAGGRFALLATNLVLASRDKHRFLKCLKGLAATFVEPLRAYLRVKLAMTRLDAVVDEAMNNVENGLSSLETPDHVRGDRDVNPSSRKGHSPYPGPREAKSRPRYKSQNPDSFKDMSESLGYDVRDTSVYWIEKKAARLRRRWKAYGRRGLDPAPQPCEQRQSYSSETIIINAVSVEPDYDTIWPPMKFPEPPPKATPPVSPSAPLSGSRDPGAQAGVTNITCHPGLEPGPREVTCDSEVDDLQTRHPRLDRGPREDMRDVETAPIPNTPALYTNRKARRAAHKQARTSARKRAPP